MIKTIRACVCLLVSAAMPSAAFAGTSPDAAAELAASIFSAGGTILAGSGQATLLQIPAGGAVIVTQYCQSGGDFGPLLQGSVFGVIPSGGSQQGNCTSYTPGVLLRGEQTVSCVSTFPGFGDTYCMITGYKVRR
jgi:hypothetical protein